MSRKSANMPDCADCGHGYREHGKKGQCFRIVIAQLKGKGGGETLCYCAGYRSKKDSL